MGLVHGVSRLPGGGVRVRLTARERTLLRSLPEQLRPMLAGEAGPPKVRDRLFPPAYPEPGDESEYRDLVGESLVEERLARLEAFATTLDAGQGGRLAWTVELSPDDAHAWLSALNDARLTLGVLLGIDDESQWERGPDDANPSAMALYYLGWLQEQLLAALMPGLDE
ncbi:MAG TPA: DUF2017 family protein [Egibacteraceae bacterium]|nr:DUF2017 family protein [Egibacteraceae bacterium]